VPKIMAKSPRDARLPLRCGSGYTVEAASLSGPGLKAL
jgi:hypothetical protein